MSSYESITFLHEVKVTRYTFAKHAMVYSVGIPLRFVVVERVPSTSYLNLVAYVCNLKLRTLEGATF